MKRDAKKMAATIGLLVGLCLVAGLGPVAAVEGVVFFDDNGNGVFDAEETGVSGVAISDGTTVVTTDVSGRFRLEPDEAARFVFASVPSGGRPSTTWYVTVAPDGSCDFPLERVETSGPLVFVQVSDIHYAPTPEEFELGLRDRRMEIVPDPVLDAMRDDISSFDVDFVLLAGDIAADSKYPEPETVRRWIGAIADRFASDYSVPVYGVVGNHDIIRDDSIGKAIYEDHFGPTYYSFNIKGTHFVVLDTHRLVGTSLEYTVDARQIAWLEQDLAAIAPEMPIIVFCHEPTYSWEETPESSALFALLADSGITALLNGHWHTNEVLREEPFYELTSGAVCGAWWEGPGPDGTGFGYRVFRAARGNLDSIWEAAGEDRVDLVSPSRAVLTWSDRLEAQVWGVAEAATYRWDDGEARELPVHFNGLWSSVAANLNVATLSDGYHDLIVEFTMTDGRVAAADPSYYVSNPVVSLEQIFDHPNAFRGKIVAAPELQVRAVMGSAVSAFDDTKTVILSDVPFPLARNDRICVIGMYHPTSASPLKAYDEIFYKLLEEEDSE